MDASKLQGCKQIYEAINKHQLEAVDFHCQMVSLFDFLNLKGFKALHEYQFMEESLEHMKTKRQFMAHHQRLLRDGDHKYKEYIEQDWYENERSQVPTQVREKSVKQAMDSYYKWEHETKEFYEECVKRMMELGCMSDFRMMEDMLNDVSDELKEIERLRTELDGVGYDSNYVFQMQDKLYDKYKKKIREIPDIKRMIDNDHKEYGIDAKMRTSEKDSKAWGNPGYKTHETEKISFRDY